MSDKERWDYLKNVLKRAFVALGLSKANPQLRQQSYSRKDMKHIAKAVT